MTTRKICRVIVGQGKHLCTDISRLLSKNTLTRLRRFSLKTSRSRRTEYLEKKSVYTSKQFSRYSIFLKFELENRWQHKMSITVCGPVKDFWFERNRSVFKDTRRPRENSFGSRIRDRRTQRLKFYKSIQTFQPVRSVSRGVVYIVAFKRRRKYVLVLLLVDIRRARIYTPCNRTSMVLRS